MRLFITYAHIDKAIVKEWIVDKLTAGGHDVWFDARLVAGQEWKKQISDEIQRSDALVYCMTPEAIASDWCQWELGQAVASGKPIIPVLLQAQTQIPGTLSQVQYVDFSDGPTGNAIARLMGGLQQLSSAQIPPAPTNPQGIPPQAIKQTEKAQRTTMMKFLRDPAIQAIIGIIGIIIAVVALMTAGGDGSKPEPTQPDAPATPATPIVIALRDLDIRSGPGADFSRLNILPVNTSLDILGISEDRLWYQILLRDGRTGWVLASSSGARLEGDRSVVNVIIPTLTPSVTLMDTSVPTNTPTATLTLSPTATATATATDTSTPVPPSATETPSNTPSAVNISTSTTTPTFSAPPSATIPLIASATSGIAMVPGQYPCTGVIVSSGSSNQLNIVYARASNNLQPIASVQRGSTVTILDDTLLTGRKWYRIEYNTQKATGWIWDSYIEPAATCP